MESLSTLSAKFLSASQMQIFVTYRWARIKSKCDRTVLRPSSDHATIPVRQCRSYSSIPDCRWLPNSGTHVHQIGVPFTHCLRQVCRLHSKLFDVTFKVAFSSVGLSLVFTSTALSAAWYRSETRFRTSMYTLLSNKLKLLSPELLFKDLRRNKLLNNYRLQLRKYRSINSLVTYFTAMV